MKPLKRLIISLLYTICVLNATNLTAQITIDDFNDNVNTNWVPGSSKYTLAESGGVLSVTAAGTGASFEGFGKTFSFINMSKHTIIRLKIMVPIGSVAPRVRLDVTDANGYDSNFSPIIINTVADGVYHDYSFNYAGKFKASWPINTNLNAARIGRLYFYTSTATGTHTGTFYIDDIVLENAQSSTIIAVGSEWKYYNTGVLPASNWQILSYDDGAWSSGNTQIGFGDTDEQTIIGFGGNTNNKYSTVYFRKKFSFVDTSTYKNCILNLIADDGAVVYLNGVELWRTNMPTGTVNYSTLASNELTDSSIENFRQHYIFTEAMLDSGDNVLAIEVHQASLSSEDLSFDLSLTGTDYELGLVRGPYLQCVSDTSVLIKWRTLEKTSGEVRYGNSSTSLSNSVSDGNMSTDHEVTIHPLAPNTKYYYSIGNGSTTYAGGDANHFFTTYPARGTIKPITVWVTGDAGRNTYEQRAMRDAFQNHQNYSPTDAWLLLGDNAYNEGTDGEYQYAMFENMFEQQLRNIPLWPSPGNHDLRNYLGPGQIAPYYDIFAMPINGESGGVPSTTEGYYSFDLANIHFISLDSYGNSRDSTAGMANWLKADLAATSQKWKIAFWHHPPHSKGTHDSDGSSAEEIKMREMREQILPLLEKYGIDLVLNGHSHVYERSYMIHKHYGFSSTFLDEPHIVNAQNSGNLSLGEEYYKNPTHNTLPNKGTVYGVVGCSGQKANSARWDSQAGNYVTNAIMHKSIKQQLGSMVLYIHGDTLTGKFIANNLVVQDQFTMIKDNTKDITLNSAVTKSILPTYEKNAVSLYPNPTYGEVTVRYTLEKNARVELEVTDEAGKKVASYQIGKQPKGEHSYTLHLDDKKSGIYTIFLKLDKEGTAQKVMKVQR